ncbi:MAG: FxLYD domain-containing protein [Thaumarchaeota archaeon]|nr:FxLYD domain-containing protein [Nitrososphaerota archaeon]
MRLFPIYMILGLVGIMIVIHPAFANVWIPDNEYSGFYDVNDTYTVIGAVKNTQDTSIVPTITINIKDGSSLYSQNYTLSTVNSQKDIPFKIQIPEIKGKNATLDRPQVFYVTTSHVNPDVDVIYDKTLKKHGDGHETGMILNNSTSPAYGIKIYAAIYGKDGKFLDVGKSIETVSKIDPGQKVMFSMYPDPQHATSVSYYSCFVVGDNPTIQVTMTRDGKPYNFTYITTGSVTDVQFNYDTRSITATVRYPFPDTGYVNFMLPEESESEKFSVLSDGKPIQFIQSKDPDGYWHVALTLGPRSVQHIAISGFGDLTTTPMSQKEYYRNYILIAIPIVVAAVIAVILKKKKD